MAEGSAGNRHDLEPTGHGRNPLWQLALPHTNRLRTDEVRDLAPVSKTPPVSSVNWSPYFTKGGRLKRSSRTMTQPSAAWSLGVSSTSGGSGSDTDVRIGRVATALQSGATEA